MSSRNTCSSKIVLLRADSSKEIGLGHIKRCLPLSHEIKRLGFTPIMISKGCDSRVFGTYEREGIDYVPIPKLLNRFCEAGKVVQIIEKLGANIIVFDSYRIDVPYLRAISKTGVTALLFDDRNDFIMPPVDYLVNANNYAETLNYRLYSGTKRLFGERYLIVDPLFVSNKVRRYERKPERLGMCLSSLGFAPFKKIMDFIMSDTGLSIEVYFTIFQKDFLERFRCDYARNKRLGFFYDLSEKELARRMKKMDILVTTGGTIMYKAAATGACVFSLPVAREQKKNVKSFAAKGEVFGISLNKNSDLDRRSKVLLRLFIENIFFRKKFMSGRKRLIDGLGARRIAETICKRK